MYSNTLQGDDEKRRGMQITPYMDRHEPAVAKLQDSFISHVVSPLAVAMSEVHNYFVYYFKLYKSTKASLVFSAHLLYNSEFRRVFCPFCPVWKNQKSWSISSTIITNGSLNWMRLRVEVPESETQSRLVDKRQWRDILMDLWPEWWCHLQEESSMSESPDNRNKQTSSEDSEPEVDSLGTCGNDYSKHSFCSHSV